MPVVTLKGRSDRNRMVSFHGRIFTFQGGVARSVSDELAAVCSRINARNGEDVFIIEIPPPAAPEPIQEVEIPTTTVEVEEPPVPKTSKKKKKVSKKKKHTTIELTQTGVEQWL